MKQSEISVDRIYHDGKDGARQVVSIDVRGDTVRYRILAAKQEFDWTAGGGRRSLIGAESSMTVTSFSTWAKGGFDMRAGLQKVSMMRAGRILLASGEQKFMESLADEPLPDDQSTVSYEVSERRSVKGLAAKGLVTIESDFDVAVTDVGWAKLQHLAALRFGAGVVDGPHATSGHMYGSIASKPVRAAEWDAEVRRFAALVDDFNVRGQREQVNHPGWMVVAKFCGDCGASLDGVCRLTLGEALAEIESSRPADALRATAVQEPAQFGNAGLTPEPAPAPAPANHALIRSLIAGDSNG